MQKRAFIIHGWEGYPSEGWFPWLKAELEKKGFAIMVPLMPNPIKPEIGPWVSRIAELVGEPDSQTFFIGHSVGCQAILRYLESLPADKKIGGAVFIAGWFKLKDITELESNIIRPWLDSPVHFENVRNHDGKFAAIFSDNDPFVPVSGRNIFKKELNAKVIMEHNKGHLGGTDNVIELPSVVKALEKIGAF